MNLLRDIRFGVRLLMRNPSYTAAALAVMAIGVGATTNVFTVVRVTPWRCRLRSSHSSRPSRPGWSLV
jgi:hypothetical protein